MCLYRTQSYSKRCIVSVDRQGGRYPIWVLVFPKLMYLCLDERHEVHADVRGVSSVCTDLQERRKT